MKCNICNNKGYFRNPLDNDIWCKCSAGKAKELEWIKKTIDYHQDRIAHHQAKVCEYRFKLENDTKNNILHSEQE